MMRKPGDLPPQPEPPCQAGVTYRNRGCAGPGADSVPVAILRVLLPGRMLSV